MFQVAWLFQRVSVSFVMTNEVLVSVTEISFRFIKSLTLCQYACLILSNFLVQSNIDIALNCTIVQSLVLPILKILVLILLAVQTVS